MDAQHLEHATRRLARTILVACAVNGGRITRGELRKAWAVIDWKPTRGEVTDAIIMARRAGRVTLSGGPYLDSSDCLIELT